eukprot:228764-Chlamydomonas_euryale.AAC.1
MLPWLPKPLSQAVLHSTFVDLPVGSCVACRQLRRRLAAALPGGGPRGHCVPVLAQDPGRRQCPAVSFSPKPTCLNPPPQNHVPQPSSRPTCINPPPSSPLPTRNTHLSSLCFPRFPQLRRLVADLADTAYRRSLKIPVGSGGSLGSGGTLPVPSARLPEDEELCGFAPVEAAVAASEGQVRRACDGAGTGALFRVRVRVWGGRAHVWGGSGACFIGPIPQSICPV